MREAPADRRQTLKFGLRQATVATSQQEATPHYTKDFWNSPRLKGAVPGPFQDWQGKWVLVPGTGLRRFGATAVALEVSKTISRPTCPREGQDSTRPLYPEPEVGR